MGRLTRFASWLLLSLATALAPAQDLAQKLDEVFKPWDRKDAPGGVVSVSVKGEVVYQKGFGMANLENDVPITLETVFDVGSVSKQFTAACAMLLQDDGKLNIDDEAAKYLPDYPALKEHKITVRQLIAHTSGLRDYMALMAFQTGKLSFTEEETVETLKGQRTLNFAPGAAWDYSNTGYFLLKEIVESLSGKSLAEFAKERLFDPLGMTKTRFLGDVAKLIPGRAFGYVEVNGEFYAGLTMVAADGAGGLWTTLADMHKWTQNWKRNRLGSDPGLFQKMQTKTKLANGQETTYGLGFFIDEYKGHNRIQHGGDYIGFHAQVNWFPEQDVIVTTFSNDGTQNAKTLNDKAVDVVLGIEPAKDGGSNGEVTLTAQELEDYVGTYDLNGLKYEFTREGTRLKAQLTGQPTFDVFASEKDKFFYKVVEARIEFSRDANGKVDAVTLFQGGGQIKCPRSQPYTMPEEKRAALIGLYYSTELGLMVNVKLKDGAMVAHSESILAAFTLEPRSDTRLAAGPLTIDIEWGGEAVRAIYVNMPRARRMKFERLSAPPDAR